MRNDPAREIDGRLRTCARSPLGSGSPSVAATLAGLSHRTDPRKLELGGDPVEAIPSVVSPTRLEQPDYSGLMARFVGERIIHRAFEQILHPNRVVGRPHRTVHRKSKP